MDLRDRYKWDNFLKRSISIIFWLVKFFLGLMGILYCKRCICSDYDICLVLEIFKSKMIDSVDM